MERVFKKQREIQQRYWLDRKRNIVPMNHYTSRYSDANMYYHADDEEATMNYSCIVTNNPTDIVIDINEHSYRYHLDNLFRLMIDGGLSMGLIDPVCGGPVIHRDMRKQFYKFCMRNSSSN